MISVAGSHLDQNGMLIANWFVKQTKQPVTGPFSSICWLKDGIPVAVALFVNYNGPTIEVHLHAPGAMNRQVLRDIFTYIFSQLKCKTAITKVKADNKIKKMLPRMGWKFLSIIPNYFGENKNDAAILYCMQIDGAKRWIKNVMVDGA